MHEVKGYSVHKIGNSAADAQSKEIGDRTKKPEKQPEKGGNNCPAKGIFQLFCGTGDEIQDRPDIEVIDPPDAETIGQTLYQRKNIDNSKRFFAEILLQVGQKKNII